MGSYTRHKWFPWGPLTSKLSMWVRMNWSPGFDGSFRAMCFSISRSWVPSFDDPIPDVDVVTLLILSVTKRSFSGEACHMLYLLMHIKTSILADYPMQVPLSSTTGNNEPKIPLLSHNIPRQPHRRRPSPANFRYNLVSTVKDVSRVSGEVIKRIVSGTCLFFDGFVGRK